MVEFRKVFFKSEFLRLLLFFLIALISLTGCAIQNVDYIKYENVKVEQLGIVPRFSVDLIFNNPNKIGCSIVNSTVIISSNADTLGLALSSKLVRLKPESEFTLPVTTLVSVGGVLNLSKKLILSNEAELNYKGSITLKKFIFKKKVQFNINEKIKSQDVL